MKSPVPHELQSDANYDRLYVPSGRNNMRVQLTRMVADHDAAHKALDAKRAPIVDKDGKPLTLAQRIGALKCVI